MIGSLVKELETGNIGIVVDTYIFMTYKDKYDKQIVEKDYYVKWNSGETYWLSCNKVEVLSENS
tara:strand:- start:1668 stop:1859 length:192 start_codon:yes stop_codon:yes gene_type:complete